MVGFFRKRSDLGHRAVTRYASHDREEHAGQPDKADGRHLYTDKLSEFALYRSYSNGDDCAPCQSDNKLERDPDCPGIDRNAHADESEILYPGMTFRNETRGHVFVRSVHCWIG